MLSALGIRRSTHEFLWYNTSLSPKIEHAFHALAIDESRRPFSPAVWERLPGQSTDLRQVWFPGTHSNVGGGYPDQGFSNTTLACESMFRDRLLSLMIPYVHDLFHAQKKVDRPHHIARADTETGMMDQLASVGVEFIPGVLNVLVEQNIDYYKRVDEEHAENRRPRNILKTKKWAIPSIYRLNRPVRPWSLHMIDGNQPKLLGRAKRSPGMYKKTDPKTGRPAMAYLEDTNERIHSSVRARLACHGLSTRDRTIWKCKPLTRAWRMRRVPIQFQDPIPQSAPWGPQDAIEPQAGPSDENGHVPAPSESEQQRWVWEYVGSEHGAPTVRILVEENMGPFEKHLLNISMGKDRKVLDRAETQNSSEFHFGSSNNMNA